MRGKVQIRHLIEVCFGITPAYAGKSESAFAKACDRQDHPRVCGEKATHLPMPSQS